MGFYLLIHTHHGAPRTLIFHFNFKMRRIVFTSINGYFLLDIPLERLKLHLET